MFTCVCVCVSEGVLMLVGCMTLKGLLVLPSLSLLAFLRSKDVDMVEHIFQFLDTPSLAKAACVCRTWASARWCACLCMYASPTTEQTLTTTPVLCMHALFLVYRFYCCLDACRWHSLDLSDHKRIPWQLFKRVIGRERCPRAQKRERV